MDAELLPYLSPTERGWLALAEAATPGPWVVGQYIDYPDWYGVAASINDSQVFYPSGAGNDPDTAFIAAARDAVPALLEALAMARRDADKYRRVLEKIAWTIGAGDDGGLGWDQGTALREIARDALTVANTYDADHPADCAGPDRPW